MDTFSNGQKYLDESFLKKEPRYYIISSTDLETADKHKGLQCLVVFVVYKCSDKKPFNRKNSEAHGQIIKLYIGDGEIAETDTATQIQYTIHNVFDSEMIINNFVSNSELNVKEDFENRSFLIVEDNIELVKQLSFLTFAPHTPEEIVYNDQNYQIIEKETRLHEFSQRNEHCKRPIGLSDSQVNRSEFQRDYEKIIHSKAFRRLVDKAQIFTSSKGDHYRTRMTHTLEVAQIARAIAIGLNLNVELTEAIALAHDLGHTPFGHQGERTLDNILKGNIPIIKYGKYEKNFYGGFKHNFQGIRVTDYLEEQYEEYEGLDLSYQVLEGVLKHTSARIKDCATCKNSDACNNKCFDLDEFLRHGETEYLYPEFAFSTTLEGQIVSIADEIAQRSHDLDDAFTSGIINTDKLFNYFTIKKSHSLSKKLSDIKSKFEDEKSPHRPYFDEGELKNSLIVSAVIDFFINDTITQSAKNMEEFDDQLEDDEFRDLYYDDHRFKKELITFSADGTFLCNYLEKIISKKVINDPEVVRFDSMAAIIVEKLFSAYYNNPRLIHKGTLRRIFIEMRHMTDHVIDFMEGDRNEVDIEIHKIIDTDLEDLTLSQQNEYYEKKKILVRAITDYISGMTDSYAINEYHKLYP